MPKMRTLWRFTLPRKWNIAPSLKTSYSVNPSFSSRCCKSTQNCKRRLWSWGFSYCNSCSKYPFTWRRLRRLTEAAAIPGSRDVFSEGSGRPVRFAAHREPLCWNFMYHSRIVLSVGSSVWYMVRNRRCSHNWLSFGKFQDPERFLIPWTRRVSSRLSPRGETCKHATAASTQKTCRGSLPIDMLLSAVSVSVVAQPSSEIPERLMYYIVNIMRMLVFKLIKITGFLILTKT